MAGEKVEVEQPTRIGILDSGVGGLSVLKEIHALLPGNPIHYVADSAWCPYGNKSAETICNRVTEIADYLLENGCELLVVACNSATIHAIGQLRSIYPNQIVGMEPAVKPAAELTQSGVVAVLATEASIAGEKFHRLVDEHAHPRGVRVITRPCPRFVELVEKGILQGPEVDLAISEVVHPLLAENADVFVLGCTHYPFLRTSIQIALPSYVNLIETGPAVAKRVRSLIPPFGKSNEESASITIETTGDENQLRDLLPQLLPGISVEVQASGLG